MLHLIDINKYKLTSVRLRSGEIQLVPRDEGALIDLQSHGYDTMGRAYRQHAHSMMSVEEIMAHRDALTRMLIAKFPEQAAA